MVIATATEIQNNFGKYLNMVQNGEEVIVMKNGKEVAKLISNEKNISFLTDAITGVLSRDYDEKEMKKERMGKYEITD